jgi:hypothetical protein
MKKILPHWVARAAIAILVVVLVFLGYSLWLQYRSIHRFHPALTDVSRIEAWMTFDYVGASFHVPPSALKASLDITDPRYPHISLSRSAKDADTDPAVYVGEVQDAVSAYLASTTAGR